MSTIANSKIKNLNVFGRRRLNKKALSRLLALTLITTVFAGVPSASAFPGGVPTPSITSLSVVSGPDSDLSGTRPSLTITGTNFTGVTSVRFGTEAAIFTVVNDTSISVTPTPVSPVTGLVNVSVTNSSGTATRLNAFTFFGAATKVAITVSSVGTASGAAFTTQPQITVQDSGSNTVTGSSDVVTATVSAGGTLVGTTTATATAGIATFTNLGITGTAGSAYTITYTVGALTVATQSVTLAAAVVAPSGGGGGGGGGASLAAQTTIVVTAASLRVQLPGTTTLTTTGGSGTGALTYTTSTPTICSVTSAGVVTAVAVGNCLITATKAADSSYLAATSSVVTLTISDSDAVAAKAAADKAVADAKAAADKAAADKAAADKAAADKAAADKVIADKAAADKVIADKAAADKVIADKAAADKVIADKAAADKVIADKAAADKVIADKAAADKVIADKAAADKVIADKAAADAAASEGGGGTAIDKSLVNSIKYSTSKTKITTITIDLADLFGDLTVDVEVKTTVLVKGKKVTKYVLIGEVTLNSVGKGMIKTKNVIKAGNTIRVSFGRMTIKTVTVK